MKHLRLRFENPRTDTDSLSAYWDRFIDADTVYAVNHLARRYPTWRGFTEDFKKLDLNLSTLIYKFSTSVAHGRWCVAHGPHDLSCQMLS
jgi:hypothetical protein